MINAGMDDTYLESGACTPVKSLGASKSDGLLALIDAWIFLSALRRYGNEDGRPVKHQGDRFFHVKM